MSFAEDPQVKIDRIQPWILSFPYIWFIIATTLRHWQELSLDSNRPGPWQEKAVSLQEAWQKHINMELFQFALIPHWNVHSLALQTANLHTYFIIKIPSTSPNSPDLKRSTEGKKCFWWKSKYAEWKRSLAEGIKTKKAKILFSKTSLPVKAKPTLWSPDWLIFPGKE